MDGLIVKKKWLDLILDGHKGLEIRSTSTKKRGEIALIESGSGEVKGTVEIFGCEPFDEDLKDLYNCHYWTDHMLQEIKNKDMYAWRLGYPCRIEPVKYKHPQGAIIWVRDALNVDKIKPKT